MYEYQTQSLGLASQRGYVIVTMTLLWQSINMSSFKKC